MNLQLGTKLGRKINKIRIEEFVISKVGLYRVIGSNGSGKSMFLRYLYKKNKQQISYLPQEVFLLNNLSVKDNLIAFDAFQYVETSELNFLLPADLSAKARRLSGGEKRKIQIYIALNSDKKMIILDEPFNNIDKVTTGILGEYIQKLSSSKIILFVDHSEILVTKEHIDIETQTEYKRLGEIILSKGSSLNIKVKYILQNLNLPSKFFLVFGGLGLVFLIFTISSLNNLTSRTNSFTNSNIEAEVRANICTGDQLLNAGTTDGSLLVDGEGIGVKLPLLERFPLSRNYVNTHKNYLFGAIKLDNPKGQIEAYDGDLPYYDVSRFVYGEYPDDNSNQVAIPYFYAEAIAKQTNKKVDSLIGSKIVLNDKTLVVSGIFRGLYSIAGNSVISSYDGVARDCNPMLNGINIKTNKVKLITIATVTGIGTVAYIIVLTAFEYSFFKMLKATKISNRLIYLLILLSVGTMIISIAYYFNYP